MKSELTNGEEPHYESQLFRYLEGLFVERDNCIKGVVIFWELLPDKILTILLI